jgi:hypothetical protein
LPAIAPNILETRILGESQNPLAEHLTGTLGCTARDAADRAAAVGALIFGVVTSRYIMRSGPLAGADPTSLTAWLGDRLQRVLDDPPSPPLVPGPDGEAQSLTSAPAVGHGYTACGPADASEDRGALPWREPCGGWRCIQGG